MSQFLRRKRAGVEPAGGRLPGRSRPVRHGPAGKDTPFETRSIPAQSTVSGPSSFRFARVSRAVERRTSVLAAASVRTVVANSRYSAACARSSIADRSVMDLGVLWPEGARLNMRAANTVPVKSFTMERSLRRNASSRANCTRSTPASVVTVWQDIWPSNNPSNRNSSPRFKRVSQASGISAIHP
jgi:hypothetical protein